MQHHTTPQNHCSHSLSFLFPSSLRHSTLRIFIRISTHPATGQWRTTPTSPPRSSPPPPPPPPTTSSSPSTPPRRPPETPSVCSAPTTTTTTTSPCRRRPPWTLSATARRRLRGSTSGPRRCCACRWRRCGSRSSGSASRWGTWRRRWRCKGGRTRRILCPSGGVGLCGSRACAPDVFSSPLGTCSSRFQLSFLSRFGFFN